MTDKIGVKDILDYLSIEHCGYPYEESYGKKESGCGDCLLHFKFALEIVREFNGMTISEENLEMLQEIYERNEKHYNDAMERVFKK